MDDFLEIMIFFGFDLDESSRYVDEKVQCQYSRELMDEIMRESCVD